MSDEEARSGEFPFDQRVAEAVSMGVPLEAIAEHLSDSKKESDKLWYQQYKSLQTAERARERAGKPPKSNLTSQQSMLSEVKDWAVKNPIEATAIGAGALGATGLGMYALKERIRTNAEIRKEKELAKLPASEAVQIQRDQLEFQKQKYADEQRALIDQETKNAIEQTRKQQLAATQNAPAPSQMDFLKQRAADLTAAVQGQPNAPAGAVPGPIARNALPASPSIFSSSVKAPTPSLQAAVATGENVTKAVQQDIAKLSDEASGLRTGSGFPAQQGLAPPVGGVENWRAPRGGNLDLNKLPSDLAFVPGMGPGLNSARQRLGSEGAQDLARQQGMPWGANEPSMARLAEFDANRVGPTLTKEQRKAAKAPPLPNTKGIPMKALGTAGVVMSIADIAQAASQGDFAPAKEAGFDIGTASLLAAVLGGPAAAAIAGGLTSTGAGESKADIRKLEHMFKVGGGRGMMPASSYPEGGLDYNSPRKKK